MTEAEAAFMKLVIQNWFNHVDNRPLDDAITDCRNAQRTSLVRSSRLGNAGTDA